MSHRKLLAGVAMVAALGAGATVGLFLGVPGLSCAQTPTPSSSASPSPGGGHRGPGFGVGLSRILAENGIELTKGLLNKCLNVTLPAIGSKMKPDSVRTAMLRRSRS